MYTWASPNLQEVLRMVVAFQDAAEPFRVKVPQAEQASVDELSPTPGSWHSWRQTGTPGLEYCWIGSGLYPDKSNLGRRVAKNEGDSDRLVIPVASKLSWAFTVLD